MNPFSAHARAWGQRRPIPAFLSFDVEPDGFQLSRTDPPEWGGYTAMFEFADQLRSSLAKRSDAPPKFGWYFRTDPQIAEVYGRADYVLARYPDRMAHLEGQGDYLGVHAHQIRWCAQQQVWVHDFGDAEWVAYSTRFSLEAHARWAGARVQRFRSGAAFLTNEIVEVIDRCGVEVDLTLEPVAGWALSAADVPTSIDTSPIVGVFTDCRTAPQVPFRPAHHDFRISGGRKGRAVVMVPLTTGSVRLEKPLWRRVARRVLRGSHRSPPQILYPSVNKWPSESFFWDLVTQQLRSMRKPYLSLAIRTDADDLKTSSRVRRIFEALPHHPLAERLQFVDPLHFAHRLV